MIKIHYGSVDGFRESKAFKTVTGARKYAHNLVGPHPEIGSYYAISGDGIGKVTVEGATLAAIFPENAP